MQTPGRSRRPRWLLPVSLVVLVAVLAGSAGAFQASRIPAVGQQVPPNATPLVVTLDTPANGATYPADALIPVRAKAAAYRPVTALELWVDGALVKRQEAPARFGQTALEALWNWQPPGEGTHTLLARAIDAAGAIGQSAVARVEVAAAAGASALVVAGQGDTLEGLAQEAGVTPEELAAENPGLDPDTPLQPGDEVYIPQEPPPAPPEGATPTPTPVPPAPLPLAPGTLGRVGFWIENQVSPAPEPPGAPTVKASVQGCDIHLAVTDTASDEQGFFIYRLEPNASSFQRIAVLGANASNQPFQYVDQQVSGHVEYYAAAFNSAGEAPGNVCGADANAFQCLSSSPWHTLPLPVGYVRIKDGRLIVTEPYDRVYYYLSVDGGLWARVPAAPDAFIPPMSDAKALQWAQGLAGDAAAEITDAIVHDKARVFDLLAPLQGLPALQASHTLELELWGWAGDSLVHLGNYTRSGVQLQAGPAQLQGLSPLPSSETDLWMCGHAGSCTEGLGWTNEVLVPWSDEDQARQFRWATDSQQAQGAVWQVTLKKPLGSTFDPAPEGLVASGTQAGKGGSFSIDFAQVGGHILPLAAAETPTLALAKIGGLSSGLEAISLVFGDQLKSAGLQLAQLPEASITFYVRVTPMDGNQPAGKPSQPMVVHYGTKPDEKSPFVPPPPTIHDVEIVGFEPVEFACLRWGCTEIVRNDYYGLPCGSGGDACLAWRNVPIGKVLCPKGWKGVGEKPWYEQLWDFVSGIADVAGQAYSVYKEGFVTSVAMTTPLCVGACKDMLRVGVDASLASIGVPAELPSLATLSGTDQDYMVGFLAQQVGTDCTEDSACRAAINAGIKQMVQKASEGGTNTACVDAATAHDHGVEPMCLPAGVVGRPATGSEFQPARVLVKITRRADSPVVPDADYEKYRLHVYAGATNGQELVGKSVTVPVNSMTTHGGLDCAYPDRTELLIEAPLDAAPFAPASVQVPRLKPGESAIVPVQMDIVPYWLPGHQELIEKAGGVVCYDDWSYLYFGGTLTVSAAVDCVTQIGQGWVNCTNGNKVDSKQYALPASWDE